MSWFHGVERHLFLSVNKINGDGSNRRLWDKLTRGGKSGIAIVHIYKFGKAVVQYWVIYISHGLLDRL